MAFPSPPIGSAKLFGAGSAFPAAIWLQERGSILAVQEPITLSGSIPMPCHPPTFSRFLDATLSFFFFLRARRPSETGRSHPN